ncbi:AAA family ATPase [Zavarzinia sp.]|uniref:AAA family ATPase n=1 Tax=Zavarzinia sp. TaxID=2027920 RepID=UPI00356A147A
MGELNVVTTTAPNTADLIELARAKAFDWLGASATRSQGDVATGTGMSRATINLFLAGTYKGDNLNLARNVLQFLERHEKTEQHKYHLNAVETPVYQAVTVALEMAKHGQRMAVIYGAPGCGKTFAAEQFAARDPKGSLIMMLRYGLGQPKGFIAELLRLLEGKGDERFWAPSRMARMIIDNLRARPRFVVVNDGQMLRFRCFEFLTAIVEQAHCGVAVIGHECMKDTISAGKRVDSETFDRIKDFSSFTHVSHLGIPKVIDQVDVDDVRRVVTQILPDITDDGVKFFADVNAFPSMRAIVQTAIDVRGLQLRSRKPQPCNAQTIAAAVRLRTPADF